VALAKKLRGFVDQRNKFHKTILLSQEHYTTWETANRNALLNAAKEGVEYFTLGFLKKLAQREEAVGHLQKIYEKNAQKMMEAGLDVAEMQARIERERQQEHQALRRQLQEERTRLSKQPSDTPLPGKSDISDEDEGAPLEYGRGPWKILVPAYSPAFLKACEHMPSPVVAKALRSLASFATHDETIWRQTRRLERLSDIYRIRIDPSHRLLIAWKEDVELKVLDLILRRDLENWIKQYARAT